MGRPSRINRSRVLTEALALADGEGLTAVTMAAVAERLGVTPMALYRHVASKAELLDGLAELLLTEAPTPSMKLAWPEQLMALANELRVTARRHPSVFPLLLQRPAATERALGARRTVYAGLQAAGVPHDRVAQVERLISTAVLGFAVSEAAGRFRDHAPAQLDDDFAHLVQLLGELIRSTATPP